MVVFVNHSPRSSPRRFLVKGSWSLSWRNSKKNLVAKEEDGKKEKTRSPTRVRFSSEIATEIPEEESPITREEIASCWYRENDYTKFEKDRVLTSLGYMARQRIGGISFDHNQHTIRGIENLCDGNLSRRQVGEKKDLMKSMNAEEKRQKTDGSFPNLEGFRAASLKHSKSGTERALALGQQDAWSYRSKPKNQMVEALTRGILRRKNTIMGHSGHSPTEMSAFASDGQRMERRRSIG